VCRAIAAAAPGIRCVLLTGDTDEAVLIDSILAGAWGCLSKQDDGDEQLRLIRRVLNGRTAYSGRFQPGIRAPLANLGEDRPDDRLLSLSKQEMNAAIGLAKGLSNRQISQELALAEKTVKNLVSSVLMKLDMASRTQIAVLVTKALSLAEDSDYGGYRFSLFPDLVAGVTEALLDCTSEAPAPPPTDGMRAGRALRLAEALAATRTGRTVSARHQTGPKSPAAPATGPGAPGGTPRHRKPSGAPAGRPGSGHS
jgi:DNA-binding NarL/FixJ family response regulator